MAKCVADQIRTKPKPNQIQTLKLTELNRIRSVSGLISISIAHLTDPVHLRHVASVTAIIVLAIQQHSLSTQYQITARQMDM